MLRALACLSLWLQAAPSPPAPAPAAAPASPSADLSSDYHIGAGDVLKVAVYRNADLSQSVVVQTDGTFMFPLVGRVKAAELTTRELEKALGDALAARYLRNPQVTVEVEQFRSKTVFVMGEVARPGTYPLSGAQTLVEILGRAGPMNPAAGSEVVVVRPLAGGAGGPLLPSAAEGVGAGAARVIHVNLADIQAGQIDKNLRLEPNDTVFVPQAPKVYVSGEVRSPGAYPFAAGTTVRQAIGLAGGLTPDGSSGRIRVVRTSGGRSHEVKVKLDDPVQPGDTIIVKAKLF